MINYHLENKVAIVTGGASGIGLVLAFRLLESGASVLINDLHATREAAVRLFLKEHLVGLDWEDRFRFLASDISSPETGQALVDEVAAAFGGLDYLLNNAGAAGTREPIPFSELDRLEDSLWEMILQVNLMGPFRLTRAAAPLLRQRHGSVVNTASVAGLTGNASSIPYAASKAALINLTQNLARGLAPDVRVNAVAPGWVDTPWTHHWPEERRQRATEGALLKRLGKPSDIADVILFLAAGASFVTGQTVVVDGGR